MLTVTVHMYTWLTINCFVQLISANRCHFGVLGFFFFFLPPDCRDTLLSLSMRVRKAIQVSLHCALHKNNASASSRKLKVRFAQSTQQQIIKLFVLLLQEFLLCVIWMIISIVDNLPSGTMSADDWLPPARRSCPASIDVPVPIISDFSQQLRLRRIPRLSWVLSNNLRSPSRLGSNASSMKVVEWMDPQPKQHAFNWRRTFRMPKMFASVNASLVFVCGLQYLPPCLLEDRKGPILCETSFITLLHAQIDTPILRIVQ
jgi:hypothetical protein